MENEQEQPKRPGRSGAIAPVAPKNNRYAEKHDMHAAWNWRNAPFLATLKHGLAPADLLFESRGSFDAIESDGRAVSTVVT